MTDLDFILAICGGTGGVSIVITTIAEFIKSAISRKQDRKDKELEINSKKDIKTMLDNIEFFERKVVSLYQSKTVDKDKARELLRDFIDKEKLNMINQTDYMRHFEYQWDELVKADRVNRKEEE